jgi:hypothetical protein
MPPLYHDELNRYIDTRSWPKPYLDGNVEDQSSTLSEPNGPSHLYCIFFAMPEYSPDFLPNMVGPRFALWFAGPGQIKLQITHFPYERWLVEPFVARCKRLWGSPHVHQPADDISQGSSTKREPQKPAPGDYAGIDKWPRPLERYMKRALAPHFPRQEANAYTNPARKCTAPWRGSDLIQGAAIPLTISAPGSAATETGAAMPRRAKGRAAGEGSIYPRSGYMTSGIRWQRSHSMPACRS